MPCDRWIIAAAVVSAAWGCGGGEPSRPVSSLAGEEAAELSDPATQAPAGSGAAQAQGSAGSDFRLSLDGEVDPLGAQARLAVQEGEPDVHLSITGVGSGSIFVAVDVAFDGVEGSMGPHQFEMGVPDVARHSVTATFEGHPYHSQAGHIDVSLSEDGRIEGTFSADLTAEPEVPIEWPFEPTPSDEVRTISGRFGGRWVLECQSRLPGHQTLIFGGDYCEGLEF